MNYKEATERMSLDFKMGNLQFMHPLQIDQKCKMTPSNDTEAVKKERFSEIFSWMHLPAIQPLNIFQRYPPEARSQNHANEF